MINRVLSIRALANFFLKKNLHQKTSWGLKVQLGCWNTEEQKKYFLAWIFILPIDFIINWWSQSRNRETKNKFAIVTYLLPCNLNILTLEILEEIFNFNHCLIQSNKMECSFDDFRSTVDGYKEMDWKTYKI